MTVTSGEGTTQAGSRAQTRGFLFADIRGYTRFVERRGAAAAADLLLRYRAIVRQAIERHAGAEIRTEGDSFYVVLQSASDAVRCGLAIVDDVAAANRDHPDDPIRVGVGIHAGEAIETHEGLVGTAVNVAARVCALAGPGEVLVTDTVRSLTRSVIDVSFTPRGQHRLKGMGDAVALFGVTGPNTTARARKVDWRLLVVGPVVLVAIAGVSYISFAMNRATGPSPPLGSATISPLPSLPLAATSPSPPVTPPPPSPESPSPLATPAAPTLVRDARPGPLAPGDYEFARFAPKFQFTIDPRWTDRNWFGYETANNFVGLCGSAPGRRFPCDHSAYIDFIRITAVRTEGCDPANNSNQPVGDNPQGFVEWLSDYPFVNTSDTKPAFIGNWTGLSIEAEEAPTDNGVCGATSYPRKVYLFTTSDGLWSIWPGYTYRFYVLSVGEPALFLIVIHDEFGTPADWPLLSDWAEELIATVRTP
jgi:class 3 adenylate cyclase